MPRRESKTKLLEQLSLAAVNVLLTASDKKLLPGFSKTAVYIMVTSGRLEEAVKYLNDYREEISK